MKKDISSINWLPLNLLGDVLYSILKKKELKETQNMVDLHLNYLEARCR